MTELRKLLTTELINTCQLSGETDTTCQTLSSCQNPRQHPMNLPESSDTLNLLRRRLTRLNPPLDNPPLNPANLRRRKLNLEHQHLHLLHLLHLRQSRELETRFLTKMKKSYRMLSRCSMNLWWSKFVILKLSKRNQKPLRI